MSVAVLSELLKPRKTPDAEFPDMKLWTLKEFDKLFDVGLLTERYELVEGVIVKKMGQNAPHRTILYAIARWLVSIFGFDYVISQSPIDFPRDKKRVSRLEPDVTVLAHPETDFPTRNPLPEDVCLLVEVADSSLQDDLSRKAKIYGQSGVIEYWVADVNARRVLVHRVPSQMGYAEITVYSETQQISSLSKPDAKILVSEFFPVLDEK